MLAPGQYRVVVVRSDSQWNAPLAQTAVKVEVKHHALFTEPSQSPEDARRDQVIQGLAEMPVSERVGYAVEIETPEGLWVLSRPGLRCIQQGCIGICDGDFDDLRNGTDFIYLSEYSEVLLMDPTGTKILRAYLMPGYPAYEMIVTDNAVFTGRVGDGGLPCSSLVRIDRETLELEGYTFPWSDGNDSYELRIWLDGWRLLEEYPREVRPDYTYDPVALEEFFASVG
jgi:hypothetical protein